MDVILTMPLSAKTAKEKPLLEGETVRGDFQRSSRWWHRPRMIRHAAAD